jgi:OmpA-OmpF porin, OOP family
MIHTICLLYFRRSILLAFRQGSASSLLVLPLFLLAQSNNSSDAFFKNLVPNPSFELFARQPLGWYYSGKDFNNVMKYWTSPTGASPDAFNPKVYVPAHWAEKGFGKRTPHSGGAMVGITIYGCDGKSHCREYVQVQLNEPLVVGQNYYVEFWTSHLPRSQQIANLDVFFSEKEVTTQFDKLLDVSPQIHPNSLLSAPNSWVKVSGVFSAETEANYLVIGNFLPDSLTRIAPASQDALKYAYYYIDDVLVRKEKPLLNVPIKEDDLRKIPLEIGKIIALKDIYFDSDSAELSPRSFTELNKLAEILRKNLKLTIEIRGHTDNIGNEKHNIQLSERRAKAVMDFLIQNGIYKQRLSVKGYGSTQSGHDNVDDVGRKQNRRVEFVVLMN